MKIARHRFPSARWRTGAPCFIASGGAASSKSSARWGLKLEDLFPPRPPSSDHVARERRPFLPNDLFEIVRAEVGVVAVIACDMNKNRAIDQAAYSRLLKAAGRLDEIASAAYGR